MVTCRTSRSTSRRARGARRRRAASGVSLALLVAAVVQQLRRPRSQRDWHGTLAGFIPYDLRRPTLDRVKASLWAPDSQRFFVPRAFGVGWSPNIPRIAAALRSWRQVDG